MPLRFFDTSKVDAFAADLAAELKRLLPPAAAAPGEKARAKLDGRIRQRVETFSAKTRLNVYQKAKLGTRLEAALQSAGYPAEFCNAFAYEVVTMLAVASASH